MSIIPKFNVSVIPNYSLTNANSFGTGCIMASANYGPTTVQFISNMNEALEMYGGGDLIDGLRLFFQGGGTNILTLRTDNAPVKATSTSGGITFTAKYGGTHLNTLPISVVRDVGNGLFTMQEGSNVILGKTSEFNATVNASSKYVTVTGTMTNDITTTLTGGTNGSAIDADVAFDSIATEDWDFLAVPGLALNKISVLGQLISTRATVENKYGTLVTGYSSATSSRDISAEISDVDSVSNDRGDIILCHSLLKTGDNTYKDPTWSACVVMGKLCSLSINQSLTFKTVPGEFVLSSNQVYNNATKEALTKAGYCVIDSTFSGTYGIVLAVTKGPSTSSWNYMLNSKMKVDYICSAVFDISKGYIGQPNDVVSRKAIQASVASFLHTTRTNRIIDDYKCVVNMGQDPRQVLINVSVKLINEIDYIDFTLTLEI